MKSKFRFIVFRCDTCSVVRVVRASCSYLIRIGPVGSREVENPVRQVLNWIHRGVADAGDLWSLSWTFYYSQ